MDVIDLSQVLRLCAALTFVLALMLGLWTVSRRYGLHGAAVISAKKKRLNVVETLSLDSRRRLAIIRCDNKEHLIILGANGETVIENDIETITQDNEDSPAKQTKPLAKTSEENEKTKAA